MFFYILLATLAISFAGFWIPTPWWGFAVICFVISVWRSKGAWQSFYIPFSAIAVLWLASVAYIDELNNSRLSSRVAVIFSLSSPVYLILITTLIGGIVGGLSGLSGFLLKYSFEKKRR